MRKVTASAVILTALTGCGQNAGIPSTQWSFEVPSGDEAKGTKADASSSKRSSASEVSADAESFLGGTYSKDMMGPAFEQPTVAAAAPAGSRVSSVGRPGSRELSGITPETVGIAGVTSSRPDPVEQVRSYLRSSGSPSALANRTPYASQVYLGSLPTPSYSSDFITPSPAPVGDASAAGSSGIELLTAGLVGPNTSAGTSNSSVATQGFSTTASIPQPEASSTSFPLDTPPAAYGGFAYPVSDVEAPTAFNLPTQAPEGAVSFNTPTTSVEDALPRLVPSQPVAEIPNLAAVPSTQPSEPIQDEGTSIGTSILQELQRSARATTPAAPVQAPVQESVAQERSVQESGFQEVAQSPITPFPVADSDRFTNDSYVPTLARLQQTMPQREISPLVASRRAAADLDVTTHEADTVQLEFPGVSTTLGSELEAVNVETFDGAPDEVNSFIESIPEVAPADPNSFIEADIIEADLHSRNTVESPLLQGLNADEVPSTIYVPIADLVTTDVSGDMIQSAVMALGQEVSTAALLDEFALQDAFSSVLTSEALLNSDASSGLGHTDTLARTPLLQSTEDADTANTKELSAFRQSLGNRFSRESATKKLLKSVPQNGTASLLSSLKRDAGERRQLITWR